MASSKGVGIRLYVDGKEVAVRDFQEFSAAGKRAFNDIGAGASGANPLLGVLSKGVGELKSGVGDLASQAGPLGNVLAALGPIGIGAAAGVTAFTLALGKAGAAANVAEGLQHQAELIGVNVERLQEFNHAFAATGIEAGAGDEALQKLNATLGQLQAGLALGRVKKAWQALGFDQEGLKQFHDATELLPILADRIRNAGDAAEQAALAKRLGIEDLLPLIRQGGDEINRLTAEARSLGLVMDASVVKQGAEAAIKLRELDDIMKTKTNVAFVQFAGTLVAIKQAFLAAETAGLSFLARVTGTTPIAKQIADQQVVVAAYESQMKAMGPAGGLLADATKIEQQKLQALRAQGLAEFMADQHQRAIAPPTGGGDARNLVPPAPGKKPALIKDPGLRLPSDPFQFQETYDASQSGHHLYIEEVSKTAAKAAADIKLAWGPLPTYFDAVNERAKHFGDIVQGDLADGIHDLSFGLADAAVNAKNAGQVIGNVFRKLLSDILGNTLEQGFSSLIKGGLGLLGFADGTDYAPGGWSIVGERGPERMYVPQGAKIYSAEASARMGGGFNFGGVSITLNAQGAGPREVDVLRGYVAQLEREIPARALAAYADFRDRNS